MRKCPNKKAVQIKKTDTVNTAFLFADIPVKEVILIILLKSKIH